MHRVPVSYPVVRRASRQGAGADADFGLEAPANAVLSRELGSCKFDKEGCIVTGASLGIRSHEGFMPVSSWYKALLACAILPSLSRCVEFFITS